MGSRTHPRSDTLNPDLSDEVAGALGSDVYLYIDPRNRQFSCIGRGEGVRLFSHLDDRTRSPR